jgi:Zn-dependent protease
MSFPGQPSSRDLRLPSIAGIPVSIAPTYLFVVILAVGRATTLTWALVHLAAVTLSILVHELGHALAAKEYGLRPSVVLHGFGGYCTHLPATRRADALVVTAAGPAAGLLLGALAWSLESTARQGPAFVAWFVYDLAWIGLAWSLVNLLPVLPLDGGSILLNRLEARPGMDFPVRTAWLVSRATAVVVAGAALWWGELYVGILFALLAWQAHQRIGKLPKLSNLLQFRKPKATSEPRGWARKGGDRTFH